jgi:NAD(P)-dependent dehydrogenase (short-subunit alcohol dehydrogenase family)
MPIPNSVQAPIGSGFGPRSTAAEVLEGIDLHGKLAVVTGGYSGLGLAAVKALAQAGAEVIVPARRPDVAREAISAIPNTSAETLDLADLDSVAGLAGRLVGGGRHIDILINNAGIMACPPTRVGNGWEAQFAVNHLGHYALVNRLWPLLDGGSRVISISSGAHGITGIHWDDLHFDGGYDKWQAYGQSKTANVLFAVHLDRLGRDRNVRAFALHPGAILTPLQRHLPKEEMVAAGWIDEAGELADPSFKTIEQGAATAVWSATSPQLNGLGGLYCEDCEISPVGGNGQPGVRPHAIDPASAARLWTLSADLTGVDAFAG